MYSEQEDETLFLLELSHFSTSGKIALPKTIRMVLPADSKEIKQVHPKGKQPLIFIGRTDAEAEAPILWPCDVKS